MRKICGCRGFAKSATVKICECRLFAKSVTVKICGCTSKYKIRHRSDFDLPPLIFGCVPATSLSRAKPRAVEDTQPAAETSAEAITVGQRVWYDEDTADSVDKPTCDIATQSHRESRAPKSSLLTVNVGGFTFKLLAPCAWRGQTQGEPAGRRQGADENECRSTAYKFSRGADRSAVVTKDSRVAYCRVAGHLSQGADLTAL